MWLLGLTGSIGMGKSTAGRMLRRMGCALHDADAAVHRLYARGGAAVAPIGRAFPGVVDNGAVDRVKLSTLVVGRPEALRRLERIVHPLVRRETDRFLRRCATRRQQVAVLEVPLLFEGGGWRRVDEIIVVSAPEAIQRRRVLARPGMSAAKLQAILARQLPDRVKRRRADYVVPTGMGRWHSWKQLFRIVQSVKGKTGSVWPPRGGVSQLRRSGGVDGIGQRRAKGS